jgi:BASS family bile acid:Na+ symporter
MGEGKVLPLQFDKIVQVFAIVLVPVSIGMAIRAKKPDLATTSTSRSGSSPPSS